MNIVLLTAHSIFEYDELRILHDLGHSVLSIGAYLDPANPGDDKRPALPEIPPAPKELRDLVADQMVVKSDLPDEVLDWADVVICHFFTIAAPDNRPGWLVGNWRKFKQHGVRVIWRTTGQSDPMTEAYTQPLRADGLQIVRYSPKERNYPNYAGEDAVIRFGKYPADYGPWNGENVFVGNVTQNMKQRGAACGYGFWEQATAGLPVAPAGPGSEQLRGGIGELSYEGMLAYLRNLRVYLYTGTVAAPYTLGLMEAMLSGVPVVSIGPNAWAGPPPLFEAHEIVTAYEYHDDPSHARFALQRHLEDMSLSALDSMMMRERAVDLFDATKIGAQWAEFLS